MQIHCVSSRTLSLTGRQSRAAHQISSALPHTVRKPRVSTLSRRAQTIVAAQQPDTEEARSPLDAPQEWEAPQPSRRPDIFPEFEKMERVFLPKPLPGDPEIPDPEEDEARKRTTPGDPDPEQKPGEVPEEPEQEPSEPGQEPEKKTDIPRIPE